MSHSMGNFSSQSKDPHNRKSKFHSHPFKNELLEVEALVNLGDYRKAISKIDEFDGLIRESVLMSPYDIHAIVEIMENLKTALLANASKERVLKILEMVGEFPFDGTGRI